MTTELTNPMVYCTEERNPKTETVPDTGVERSTIVNMLTKADREWQAEVTQTISDLKTLNQCEEFLAKLESATTDGDVDVFDRGLAVKSWAQGAVLTRIKPLPKKDEHGKPVKRSRIPLPMHNGKRMTLAQFVQDRLPFSVSTAHWVRKVFDVFTLEDIRVLGYREMISQLAPSFRKALDDGPPNTPDDGDEDGESGSEGTASESGETTGGGTGDGGDSDKPKIKPLAITQIPKKLDDICNLIDRMAAVSESPNRYNNVSRHLDILSDQRTRIDTLQVKLAALPAALELARQDISQWHEQGIVASHEKADGKPAEAVDGEGRVS